MADIPQERDQDVVTFRAFAGVRNDIPPERLAVADLEAAENVDIDASGRVSSRQGYTQRSAAATHSLWSDRASIALCVQGSALKRVNADYSLATLRAVTPGLRMSYTKVNDNVYFTNGVETGVLENGAARSWGLPVPPLPAVAVGVGSLPAGTYQFVVTYVRIDGQESGAGLAGRASVGANAKLTFSLPVPSDPAIVTKNIYLSRPNGDTLYLAFSVAANVVVAAYAGDAKELTYDLKTQFLSPPPAGHIAGYFNGRVYVAVGDVLFPSEPFAYELFDLRAYIPLSARCTLLAPLEDKEALDQPGMSSGIFVGTTGNCGVLVGSKPEDFRYVPKVDYGAIEGAMDYVEGTHYADGAAGARKLPMWLTTQGVCVGLPNMEIRNVTAPRFSATFSGTGAAVFQPDSQRFVAVSNL
jgi:hypothetical protein